MSEYINFYALFNPGSGHITIPIYEPLGLAATDRDINKAIFGILSCLIGYIVMWLIYNAEYSHFQRNNGRELNSYITRYLANLNSHYRQADAEARGAVMVDSSKLSQMADDAQMWFILLQWHAFRVFFIEWFLRNIFFQVMRNSSYYLVFIPLGFILLVWRLSAAIGADQLSLTSENSMLYQQNTFYILFPLLLWVYYHNLRHSIIFIQEAIHEREWVEFHSLKLETVTRNIVGRYTTEIRNWRGRFSGQRDMGN